MPSNTPVTQALLPVTAEDVEAALATFDGGLVRQNDERNARGYTTFYHPKDSMRAVLEEFSARQSSSNAGGVDEAKKRTAINGILAGLLLPLVADPKELIALGNQACTEILTSLSTPTAEPPSPCPGDVDEREETISCGVSNDDIAKMRELIEHTERHLPKMPWRVIPSDGKPTIAGRERSGNLFRGYIATWKEADLACLAVNSLPALLDEVEMLRTIVFEALKYRTAGGMRKALEPALFAAHRAFAASAALTPSALSEDEPLGRFGHHPDPATDFEHEVDQIEAIITDLEKGMRAGEAIPLDRIDRAMGFRVGGDAGAVAAKASLRKLETRALALTTPPTPHEFVKNPLIPFPSCQVCMGPEDAEAHSPPTPDRIGKDAVREALLDAKNALIGYSLHPSDRKRAIAVIDAALSATPAQPVDETERLREALRKIADDPYQHGQRIQKMKAIARAALQHKGEVSRG